MEDERFPELPTTCTSALPVMFDYKGSLGFRLVTLRLHYPKLSNRPTVDSLVNQRVTAPWKIQVVSD
jgi:hypothetical protein